MKIKTLVVQAVAGLALCGLFASGASAAEPGGVEVDETSGVFLCNHLDSAEEAWFRSHFPSGEGSLPISESRRWNQETIEAVQNGTLGNCALAMVPLSQNRAFWDYMTFCLDLEGPGDWNKVDAEWCISARENGVPMRASRKRRHSRHKRHPKKGRHRPASPTAEIALAR